MADVRRGVSDEPAGAALEDVSLRISEDDGARVGLYELADELGVAIPPDGFINER